MGSNQIRIPKTDEERNAFVECVLNDLEAMEYMLEEDLFERDVQRIGSEQELYLIKNSFRANPINMEVLDRIEDKRFTTEHSRYNLEINADPLPFSNSCLSDMEQNIKDHLEKVRSVMKELDGDVALCGILPTLRMMDLDIKYITPLRRYKALCQTMNEMKGGPFEMRITGTDELVAKSDTTMFEGSNTSFQVHLQVDPEHFVDQYNFAQLITAPTLAAATNSPFMLGKRLWHETRIALFQQSVDVRKYSYNPTEKKARVSFGDEWLEGSVVKLFKDNVSRHRVLLIIPEPQESLPLLREGKIPKLQALQAHSGTIYTWNRACFGLTDGIPHLRIENRVLPAGPTVEDEMANAAFWLGVMNAPQTDAYRNLPDKMDFDEVKNNFIKAARYGLDTQFSWIDGAVHPADQLILDELLPMAFKGLEQAGIDEQDRERYLGIIRERVKSRQTGSRWMLNAFNKLKKEHPVDLSLVALTAGMHNRQWNGKAVHEWDLPDIEEAGDWKNRFWRIDQIMTTDVFSVRPSDPVSYVNQIMNWKYIRHVPVEDEQGQLVGVITSRLLLEYYGKREQTEASEDVFIRDIMHPDPYTVRPKTTIIEAIQLMKKHNLGFLPVVSNSHLAGIVTEHDFMQIAEYFMKQDASKR